MMHRLLPALVAIGLLFGCATHPLPMIDRQTYVNPEYAFSFELPEGWGYRDSPPEWVREGLSFGTARSVVVFLSSSETTGFIMISGAKFSDPIDTAGKIEEIRAELRNGMEAQKIAAELDPGKAYFYKLHDAIVSIEPQIVLNQLIMTENDFMKLAIHGSSYLYLCRSDTSCGLDVVLISDARTFDTNNVVYQRLLRSLSGIAR